MDCYEAIATLTAAAMDTRHVRLGSDVYCLAYRNPGLLAKFLTTIDHLSNGRVECGLARRRSQGLRHPLPHDQPPREHARGVAQINGRARLTRKQWWNRDDVVISTLMPKRLVSAICVPGDQVGPTTI
jgi:alkanesulfonate monooxygenase SsuD/methylene tetrahydromethanopterin reductase-like flavin-dependent oxidoreductase (luciferase family)